MKKKINKPKIEHVIVREKDRLSFFLFTGLTQLILLTISTGFTVVILMLAQQILIENGTYYDLLPFVSVIIIIKNFFIVFTLNLLDLYDEDSFIEERIEHRIVKGGKTK